MSGDELITAEKKELSQLQIFGIKVGIVAAAIIIVLYCAGYFLQSFIAMKTDELAFLKGGPVFWERVEQKLLAFAEQPDLPPEKKQKIINALRRISSKYKPYVDALGDELATTKAR